MEFLLDTNAIIALLGNKSAILVERVEACRASTIGVSTIVMHELYFGAYRSQRIAYNMETLRLFFRDFQLVDFDPEDARVSGEIRANLRKSGLPIGSYDSLIAGQALARSLTLVTNNTREFERVDGLKIEDWL